MAKCKKSPKKSQFPTMAAALRYLRTHSWDDCLYAPNQAYKCKSCGYYHLSSNVWFRHTVKR